MSPYSLKKQAIGLAGWLLVSFITAAIGGAASVQASSFYTRLARPDWAPPPWVFGPVWAVLYALMGVSAWLVWRAGASRASRTALALFLVQLAPNAVWSYLFFVWQQGAWAFADILLLCSLVVATLVSFYRVSLVAGALLVPYLLWVGLAAALNYSVWQLNPKLLG